MSVIYTQNYTQLGGITKWAVVHAWGEGNMIGLQYVITNQPITTNSTNVVSSVPETGLTLPGFGWVDGIFDVQLSGKVFMQTQQTIYSNGGGGGGVIIVPQGDFTLQANNPVSFFYNAYGIGHGYTYAQTSVSPIMSYVKALLNSLPSNTGIIIAPTANFSNANGSGYGIQAWQAGATPVTIDGSTASLFYNVNHVLATALAVPGAYFHSHVCLIGEYDLSAQVLLQDQFSYYFNRFFAQLNYSLGINSDCPIVVGNMCRGWMALQPNGLLNPITLSLQGVANRHRKGVFVDSVVNPAVGVSSGVLGSSGESFQTNGANGPYYGPTSLRTMGLNLFNYGYIKIPVNLNTYVTPPVNNLVGSATSSTNVVLTWASSINASAYDFLVSTYNTVTGAFVQSTNTLGLNGVTVSGLTAGVLYRFNVQALSDFGLSAIVSYTGYPGNSGSEISLAYSSLTLNRTLAPSDNTTAIVATVTLKNTLNQVIIGYNTGLFQPISGLSSLFNITPGAANIGNALNTDVNGQAVWSITCATSLSTTATATYDVANLLMLPAVTFTFGNPNVLSSSLSTLTFSSFATPADGVSTTTITATYISLGGTAMSGYTGGGTLVGTGSTAQVYFTPGNTAPASGGPGTAQTANGSGQVAWVLKSGNYIGGNPALNLSTSGITQTTQVSFAAQVATANVDFVIPASSATTPNSAVAPPVYKGDYVTPVTGYTTGLGLAYVVYTTDTINGQTKNWLDLRPVQQGGSNRPVLVNLPAVTLNFSYSFWMKLSLPTSLPNNVFTIIFGDNTGSPPNANFRVIYCIYQSGSPNTYIGMTPYVYTNGSGAPYVNPLNAWHHFVVTYNNTTNTVAIYMDGVTTPVGGYTGSTNTGNSGGFNPTGGTNLGSSGSGQPTVPAQMADMVQYNIALTPTQVAACYNSWFLNP